MLKLHMYADAKATMAPRRMLDSCTGWSELYGQCGGITCEDGGTTCSDTAYNCCPTETSCQRQNQWYWQCLPEPVSPNVKAAPTGNTSPQPGMCSLQSAYQSLFDASNTAWLTLLALHTQAARCPIMWSVMYNDLHTAQIQHLQRLHRLPNVIQNHALLCSAECKCLSGRRMMCDALKACSEHQPY